MWGEFCMQRVKKHEHTCRILKSRSSCSRFMFCHCMCTFRVQCTRGGYYMQRVEKHEYTYRILMSRFPCSRFVFSHCMFKLRLQCMWRGYCMWRVKTARLYIQLQDFKVAISIQRMCSPRTFSTCNTLSSYNILSTCNTLSSYNILSTYNTLYILYLLVSTSAFSTHTSAFSTYGCVECGCVVHVASGEYIV